MSFSFLNLSLYFACIVTSCQRYIAGFHAKDPESFAQAVHEVISMSDGEQVAIRERARRWATITFSEEAFERGWTQSGWAQWF